jgi:hypothetical protein
VKLDAAYVKRIADATGFDAVQLEKVIRLRQLLIEFRKHPFLRRVSTTLRQVLTEFSELFMFVEPAC